MIKKIFIPFLMIIYLYTLTFGIFLTPTIRIPAPIIIGPPLLFLYGNFKGKLFLFKKELFLFTAATFFAYVLAQSNVVTFVSNLIIVFFCILYFNYFINDSWLRFKSSVFIFYLWLSVSSIIMLLNHVFPPQINELRIFLTGEPPMFQSPSGITPYIFNFGYQAAALTSFIFTYGITHHRNLFIKIALLIISLIVIYFGLQRSVLLTFSLSSVLFIIVFYKMKSVVVLGFAFGVILLIFSVVAEKTKGYDNIFAKNERDSEGNRSSLVIENLKILTDYPYGLMFYGKSWTEVTRDSSVLTSGLTSHNAYLMFVTYLGPFLGLGLLIAIYHKIWKIFRFVLANIYDSNNALLICLCFSFLSVSLNSMSHNAWLLNGNGPTIFLYFAIIHHAIFFSNRETGKLESEKLALPKSHIS